MTRLLALALFTIAAVIPPARGLVWLIFGV